MPHEPMSMMTGLHAAAMAGLVVLVGGVLAILVHLARPRRSGGSGLERFLHHRLSGLRVTEVRPLSGRTFVVLADITGYTRFLQASRFSADHAQYLVLKLLEAVVVAAGERMRFVKLEGDAALFVSQGHADDGGRTASPLRDMVGAFYATRDRLGTANLCPCLACTGVRELDVKFAVDRGAVAVYAVNDQDDVSGVPLIRAHRLLKAHLAQGPHVVVAADAVAGLPLEWAAAGQPFEIDLEGFGLQTVTMHRVDPARAGPPDGTLSVVAARIGTLSSLAGKLARHAG
jgi:hypothetical protein